MSPDCFCTALKVSSIDLFHKTPLWLNLCVLKLAVNHKTSLALHWCTLPTFQWGFVHEFKEKPAHIYVNNCQGKRKKNIRFSKTSAVCYMECLLRAFCIYNSEKETGEWSGVSSQERGRACQLIYSLFQWESGAVIFYHKLSKEMH